MEVVDEVPQAEQTSQTHTRPQATEYLILEQVLLHDERGEQTQAWVEIGMATTATRQGAVQEVVGEREGVWRAVATRSWQHPIRTRTETVTKLKVEALD